MKIKMWIKKKLLRFFVVQWLLTKVLPKIRFSLHRPKMNAEKYAVFYRALRPGDLVFSVDRSKLSTFLIGGKWSHVGIYVDHDNIVEAVYPLVRFVHPLDFCFDADCVGVGRPKYNGSEGAIYEATLKAATYVGRHYDTLFEPGTEALYCSELVSNVVGLQVDRSDEVGLGQDYVTPDEVWRNVVPIYDST